MAVSGMLGVDVPWSNISALAILMSLPVVLVFLLIRRYLVRGLLIGRIDK